MKGRSDRARRPVRRRPGAGLVAVSSLVGLLGLAPVGRADAQEAPAMRRLVAHPEALDAIGDPDTRAELDRIVAAHRGG